MPLPLIHALTSSWPPGQWADLHVVIAVSGGADSVALLATMHELKTCGAGRLYAAHFHHGLRGADADADAAFVGEFCQRLSVPLDVGRGDVGKQAEIDGDGLEAAARAARYEFLLQTAQRHGARFVATAHTADDQAETILHHILRGTGIAGLAGMPRTRALSESVTLIRPLLDVRREDVLAYLTAHDLSFREDASNRDVSLTRNRIRHELLPQLRNDYNPAVTDALLRLGALAGESQAVIDELAKELTARCATCGPNSLKINCAMLADVPRHLVREALQRAWRTAGLPLQGMGYQEWDTLANMVSRDASDAAPRDFPGAVHAKRECDQLLLTLPK